MESNGQNGVARKDGKVLNERKNTGWRVSRGGTRRKGWTWNGWMEIVTEH